MTEQELSEQIQDELESLENDFENGMISEEDCFHYKVNIWADYLQLLDEIQREESERLYS